MAHRRPNARASRVPPTGGSAERPGPDGSEAADSTDSESQNSQLQSGLLHAQAALDNMSEDNSHLRRENAALKAKAKTLPAGSANPRSPFSGPLTVENKKDLQGVANKWMYFENPWISQANFGQPRPDPNELLPAKERYEDDTAILAYLTETLYQYVPVKFHNLIENFETFGSDFVRQVKNQRSTTMFRLHSTASTIFSVYSDILPETWNSADARSNDERCRRLYLTEDEESGELVFNALLAPIIYASDEVSISGIFQNEVLFLIGICTLYGPTALRDGKFARNSLGAKWKQASVTAGFIAWTCVAAIHLLSHDFPFEELGKQTGINYGDTFNEYKQRIEVHQDSALFCQILAKWNRRLKLGPESAAQSTEATDPNSKGRSRVNARAASIDAALSNMAADLSISSTPVLVPQASVGIPDPSTSHDSPPLSSGTSASGVHREANISRQGPMSSISTTSSTARKPNSLSARKDSAFMLSVPTPSDLISFDHEDNDRLDNEIDDDHLDNEIDDHPVSPNPVSGSSPTGQIEASHTSGPLPPVSNEIPKAKVTQQSSQKGSRATKPKAAVPALRRSNRK